MRKEIACTIHAFGTPGPIWAVTGCLVTSHHLSRWRRHFGWNSHEQQLGAPFANSIVGSMRDNIARSCDELPESEHLRVRLIPPRPRQLLHLGLVVKLHGNLHRRHLTIGEEHWQRLPFEPFYVHLQQYWCTIDAAARKEERIICKCEHGVGHAISKAPTRINFEHLPGPLSAYVAKAYSV